MAYWAPDGVANAIYVVDILPASLMKCACVGSRPLARAFAVGEPQPVNIRRELTWPLKKDIDAEVDLPWQRYPKC
jgi:hypothetical protein